MQAFFGGKDGLLRRMTLHSQQFVINEISF